MNGWIDRCIDDLQTGNSTGTSRIQIIKEFLDIMTCSQGFALFNYSNKLQANSYLK